MVIRQEGLKLNGGSLNATRTGQTQPTKTTAERLQLTVIHLTFSKDWLPGTETNLDSRPTSKY